MLKTDVLVVGAGIVGLAAALALVQQGLQVVIVDRGSVRTCDQHSQDLAAKGLKSYALTPGIGAWLDTLGLSHALANSYPIRSVSVYANPGSEVKFFAERAGFECLFHMVTEDLLKQALWARLRQHADRCMVYEAQTPQTVYSPQSGGIRLYTEAGLGFEATLLLGADGAASWVRQHMGIDWKSWADRFFYHRQAAELCAITGIFKVSRFHANQAQQWFFQDSILAVLPLSDEVVSIVWSMRRGTLALWGEINSEQVAEQMAQSTANLFGTLRSLSEPKVFGFYPGQAEKLVSGRCILMGDSAHVLHPLMGQGLNLGLRDVSQLAKSLENRPSWRCIADPWLLQQYERHRQSDVFKSLLISQKLFSGFDGDFRFLMRLAMMGVESSTYLKQSLVGWMQDSNM